MGDTPRNIEAWAKIRKGGKTRYIIRYGMLYWGVPMFLIMTFLVNRTSKVEPVMIAVLAFIWAAAGAFFGWAMWKVMEGMYLKFQREQEGGGED